MFQISYPHANGASQGNYFLPDKQLQWIGPIRMHQIQIPQIHTMYGPVSPSCSTPNLSQPKHKAKVYTAAFVFCIVYRYIQASDLEDTLYLVSRYLDWYFADSVYMFVGILTSTNNPNNHYMPLDAITNKKLYSFIKSVFVHFQVSPSTMK